jgi:hypothetical protein
MRYALALTALTVLALVVLPAPAARPEPRDFTKVSLEELGVTLVKPKEDPKTGFVVGGKNPTALLGRLTEINGRSIAELEKDMRPGASSKAGFLGKDERLPEVLAADNKFVVDERGLTHQELARALHVLGAVARWQAKHDEAGKEFVYRGRKFTITLFVSKGFVPSPFADGTRTNEYVELENVAGGKKLSYSLLLPDMIERYGFYEGKGTPYRVEPAQVLEVCDFLRPARTPTPPR